MAAHRSAARIDTIDYAKGLCIILVVMMHSTLGVEAAAGEVSWLNGFIEWARPFRMPDFFLIAGLFLASRIDRPWRDYLDSKVIHFAYFYGLWLTIQFLFKAPALIEEFGASGTLRLYVTSFIEPWGTLWFIHMLAIFFIVTKLLQRVPMPLVWAVAAVLEIAPIDTGSILIDEFAARFVFFYSGYVFAPLVFSWISLLENRKSPVILAGLMAWAAFNTLFVVHGWADLPVLSLILGYIGAAAVVTTGLVMSRSQTLWAPVRYCGQHSIVIYLSFFLFMATSRIVLLKLGIIPDTGAIALIVTAAGLIGPVILFWMVRATPFRFLFARPAWFKIAGAPAVASPSIQGR